MKRPAALEATWWQERALTVMLVSLVLALFVGGPLMAMASVGPLPFDIFFTSLLLSGIVAFSRRRKLAIAISVIGLAVLVLRWTSYGQAEGKLVFWDNLLSLVLLTILTALVLEHVFRAGPITGDRIQGAVAAYLLLGLSWALAYALIDHVFPGGMKVERSFKDMHHDMQAFFYFSFVTLTTVGYGDITPVHPAARMLAVAEALVGQLYPAVLIGRLVSLQISPGRSGQKQ
ncbi:MAG: potassium channel family protein [Acidobacteriota bacterium]